MARRYCPVCKKEVEERVTREKDEQGREIVTKSCPECGFVFIKYKIGVGVLTFMNEPVPEYPKKKMRKLF